MTPRRGPLLLTRQDRLPPSTRTYVEEKCAVDAAFIYGDEGVVSRQVAQDIAQALAVGCGP